MTDISRDIFTDWIAVMLLTASPGYQWIIDEAAVRRMVRNPREDAWGTIVVSMRSNGDYVVIDGQHRVTAMMRINPERSMKCEVHVGMSYEQEAELFTFLQKSRKQMSQVDTFRAMVEQGDEKSLAIKRIVEHFGLTISRRKSAVEGEVAATKELEMIMGTDPSGTLLSQVLYAITEAWGRECKPNRYSLGGVYAFIRFHRGNYDHDRFVKILAELGEVRLKQLMISEAGLASVDAKNAGGRILTRTYNKGLRSKHVAPWVDFTTNDNKGLT